METYMLAHSVEHLRLKHLLIGHNKATVEQYYKRSV